MSRIKSIWEKTFLAKTFREDPRFGTGTCIVLCIYVLIHIAKLEVFPLYMFAMYSQPEEPVDSYISYKVTCDELPVLDAEGARVEFTKKTDYRSYTYVKNTITQYVEILENNLIHPESKVYDKFINKLHLTGSNLDQSMQKPFVYNKTELDKDLYKWLCQYFNINDAPFRIEKRTTKWDKTHSPIIVQDEIYELVR